MYEDEETLTSMAAVREVVSLLSEAVCSDVWWSPEELADHGITKQFLDRLRLMTLSLSGEAELARRGGTETSVGI